MRLMEEIGLAIVGYKVFDLLDTSTELKKEQITQTQLQNENMMLKNKIARMEAEKREAEKIQPYTLADVTEKHRKESPHLSDADWQEQINRANKKMGYA